MINVLVSQLKPIKNTIRKSETKKGENINKNTSDLPILNTSILVNSN